VVSDITRMGCFYDMKEMTLMIQIHSNLKAYLESTDTSFLPFVQSPLALSVPSVLSTSSSGLETDDYFQYCDCACDEDVANSNFPIPKLNILAITKPDLDDDEEDSSTDRCRRRALRSSIGPFYGVTLPILHLNLW
jgi:hypothetical protein